MKIEIVYALPEYQYIEALEVPENATIKDALNQMVELSKQFPNVNWEEIDAVGIFGKKMSLDTVLKMGDRIELYRPLVVDPKEARRSRAKASDENVE